LFSNRTTIVIAHRLTTIANASKILMFDHGELIEEGTHKELLAKGGKFKALYETYYSHQGITEISEDIAETAKIEVEKHGGEEPIPSGPLMMMHGMGGGGMGAMGGMRSTPEMIERAKERYKSDPDSIPEPFREMIKKMVENEENGTDDGDGKDTVRHEETVGHGGPIGSGRPSPEMMKRLLEQYKKDPNSVPAHMHSHFEKMLQNEEE
jgi:ABC-type multidrug transport system ATPase subunit